MIDDVYHKWSDTLAAGATVGILKYKMILLVIQDLFGKISRVEAVYGGK
jgi:hypothetical protein